MTDPGLWRYRARGARVIDGDTVEVEVDCGFSVRVEAAVRLLGVDAPELREPGGIEARAALSALVAEGAGAWPLVVRTARRAEGGEARSFLRYVGQVWTVGADGRLTDVGEAVVASGRARRREGELGPWERGAGRSGR